MRKVIAAFLFGLFACGLASASTPLSLPYPPRYVFEKVGDDAGLATVTPGALFQDRQGFIWIGTDHALIRYDGSHAVVFGSKEGWPGVHVEQVAQLPGGNILAASRQFLGIVQGDRIRPIHLPSLSAHFAVHQPFALLPNGHIYMATDRGLFSFVIDDTTGQALRVVAPIERGAEIEAVYAAPDGKIWFAEPNRVGWMFEHGALHWIPKDPRLGNDPAIALLRESSGVVWLRTTRHLARLDLNSTRFRQDFESLPSANDVGLPALDRHGRLMIPTVSGLFLHQEDRWDRIDSRRGAASNAVLSVIEDREGAFWLGYGGHGVERWQGGSTWSGWTVADGLPDNVVWSEARDHQGRLWLGTNDGLALWDEPQHRFRVWHANSGLNGSIVRHIAVAADGSIWALCHPGGLTRIDPVTLRPEKVSIGGKEPSFLAPGPDGSLWLTGSHFIKSISGAGDAFRVRNVPVARDISDITHFSFTAGGRTLWIASHNGLSRFSHNAWQTFTSKDGLASDNVSQVVSNSSTDAWVRYSDVAGVGHLHLTDSRIHVETFGAARGLPSDEVYTLGLDRTGMVWTGGPNGVASITPNGVVRAYGHSDGLIWEDQSEDGFFAESDGTLLFGTSGGLARFDPSAELALPIALPRVVFTSTRLGAHERPDGFSATHVDNTLQINFAVLSYRDAASVRCQYRLNGLESDFIETGLRELRYPALRPGSYSLELSCRLPSGLSSEPIVYSFKVLPAWWQTWWARTLAIAGILFALYGVLRLRTLQLERDRARLERAVAERSRELEKANRELTEAALTDPLTGTRNRRFFQVTIEGDINQTIRAYKEPGRPVRNRDLIFYLIDADHFKEVNDRLGHDAGDELLIEMTRRISCAIRQSDVLVRWGGEEFLVVSRYTERSEATALASRILKAIGSEPFLLTAAKIPLRKTCSIGWTALPWLARNPEALAYGQIVALADHALYAAKQSGRNRAVGFVPSQETLPDITPETAITPELVNARRIETAGPDQETKDAEQAKAHGA